MASAGQKLTQVTVTEIHSEPSRLLGHLTESQLNTFNDFKQNLTSAGLYSPQFISDDDTEVIHASHDDATLLRFLRARQFDLVNAQKQFKNALDWRELHSVDELFITFPVDEFESARKFYPRWTGRRDKRGLPLYVYRLAALKGPLEADLNETPNERRYQRIIVLYESMTRFVLPLCASLTDRTSEKSSAVTSVTTIIDLGHISLASMWSLRHHLQQASLLATANYPETLNTIAVVNAPTFFPTVWGWIKNWFDEGTRNKIHVLGKDMSFLRQLIDLADLPKPYGGDLPWQFEDEPLLDDNLGSAITEMPRGPAVYQEGAHSTHDLTRKSDEKEIS